MKHFVCILILGLLALNTNAQTGTHHSSSLSISVVENDSEYTYRASFDKGQTDKVKSAIKELLGAANDTTQRTALWEKKYYTVGLRAGRVNIEMDLNNSTKSTALKIKDLGEHISETLSSKKTPTPPSHR
ncbi:hypothetical protein NBRC110019_30760 [Neptunitalea chrysea]|uniref:Uncharacterized protein n=1 Tax=Neptunitalea chrysea TaxID=1647581 RepID=A0A9W6EUX5_9FLAO|nr:hypothetical protein [Neptunitalea chrysea]GLB54035.1 hypothetical protein NBRC110019_30760 [Neptunitalea chrysea]